MAYLALNARSELVTPRNFSVGGVVEIILMFHAACAASHRPGFRPTRGSGLGAVAETIGVTGAGMTAGGGGGGGGGVPRPRPPRPRPSPAGASPDGAAVVVAAGAGAGVAAADAVELLVAGAAVVAGGVGAGVDGTDVDFGAHATASSVAAAHAQRNDLTS